MLHGNGWTVAARDPRARLQHPGIAQIYQAGTYETEQGVLPYFAMEYVEGVRLDLYVYRHRLSIRARLRAAKIADAVEHAHQKNVIHRDLKPGNILVTDQGQPKILDFGLGRLNDDEARTTTLRTDMGQELVEHDAQRIDVGARVAPAASAT